MCGIAPWGYVTTDMLLSSAAVNYIVRLKMMFSPERHLPTPGQRGHSPQRHTVAGTATPTTADTGNIVPQRANPIQTAYAHPRRRAQA